MLRSKSGYARIGLVHVFFLLMAATPAYAAGSNSELTRIGVSAIVIQPAEIETVTTASEAIVRVRNADELRVSASGAVAERADGGFRLSKTGASKKVTVTVEY